MAPGKTTTFMALEAKSSFGSDSPVSRESSHTQYTSKQVWLWPEQLCLQKVREKETRKPSQTRSGTPDISDDCPRRKRQVRGNCAGKTRHSCGSRAERGMLVLGLRPLFYSIWQLG